MPYNRMKLAVGAFVIALFVAISTFLYFLLEEKGAFEKRYTYHFETDSATAFNVGMPLKFSGFNIGVIDDIALKDDGTVHMSFSVTTENRKWISQDSVLMIRKPLIGSPHIEVYSAIGNPPLEEGATLIILMSDDINDMISKLEPAVERIINIIYSVDKITSYLAKEDSELMLTLRNIRIFSDNLAQNKALLTSITGDKEATDSVVKSLKDLSKMMEDIQGITHTLDEKIINPSSSTINELNDIMKDVKGKLQELDGVVNSVGKLDQDVIELKEHISVGMQKSNQLMDKVDALMQDESKDTVELP